MGIIQILSIIQAGLVAAQAVAHLTPQVVQGIQDAIKSIDAAIGAHQQAQTSLDPNLIKPIEPVV